MKSIFLFIKSIFSTKSKVIYLIKKGEKICDSIAKLSNNKNVKYNCNMIKNILIEIEGLI